MSTPEPQLDINLKTNSYQLVRNAVASPLQRVEGAGAARKVPAVILMFWIIKLLTTAMGETTSDYLVYQINPLIAVALGGIGLAVALLLQLSARRYVAWIYWLAVAMVAVTGTMAADVLRTLLTAVFDIGFGTAYLISTVFYAIVLTILFTAWYTSEKTLSIHSIFTRRRELFYWATVMATFALGTAAGDMTALTLHLGYFVSGLFFAIVFAIPAIGYRLFGLNEIVAFWFAYVMTRPLGASFADWLGKPHSLRGLALGERPVSVVLALMIASCVGYLSITHIDVKPEDH